MAANFIARLLRPLSGPLFAALACSAFGQSLETAIMPGPVIEGHAKLEADCGNCHVRFNRAAQSGLCLDCHKDVARDVARRAGYHGRVREKDCRACHTDHKGRGTDIAAFDARAFDHRSTDFALRGAHASASLECKACHVAGRKFREAPSDCHGCHAKDDKHRGSLGNACADCHTEKAWKETRFDHGKTRFPLRNRHADVQCRSCHQDPGFKGAPLACVACHQKDDQKKGHQGRFGDKCASCHTDRGWRSTTFNHDRDTKYPLKGLHQRASCHSCHRAALQREKPPTACVACHKADDAKKGHRGRFGDKCESCHVEKGWSATTFNHARDARYPLRGRHAQARCAACHTGVLYREKLATSCLSCHRKDDAHKGQLGPKCESCHNEASWKQTRLDHDLTRFPLLGKHAQAKCKDCHVTAQFKDAPSDCYACHRRDDRHRLRLGTRCEECHQPRSWKQWEFDHNRRTSFVLDGKHRGLDCLACHKQPMQARVRLAATCASCHDDRDVHHGSFGRACESCHVTSSFKTIKAGASGRLFQ